MCAGSHSFWFIFVFVSSFPAPLTSWGLSTSTLVLIASWRSGSLTWLSLAALGVMVVAYGSRCCGTGLCFTDELTCPCSIDRGCWPAAELVLLMGLGLAIFFPHPSTWILTCWEWKHGVHVFLLGSGGPLLTFPFSETTLPLSSCEDFRIDLCVEK